MPAALALYRNWFRVRARRAGKNIPDSGAALIVANHSGVLPLDAIMLQAASSPSIPPAGTCGCSARTWCTRCRCCPALARRSGHTRADPGEALRLLAAGELVGVFPEGFKGTGKPFSDRYQLQRFGRGGFARTAVAGRRADNPVRHRRRRGDLPHARQLADAGPGPAAAVLPADAAVPLAWPGGRRAAAVEVDHRVLRGSADAGASA